MNGLQPRILDGESRRLLSVADLPHISLRTADRGGPLAKEARLPPGNLLEGLDDLLILIHGYANDQDEAFRSYRKFLANLGLPSSITGIGLYWPGDSWASHPLDRAGTFYRFSRLLSYSWQPRRAAVAGEMLAKAVDRVVTNRQQIAKWDRSRLGTQTIHIVAHSIGCRLALEFMKNLDFLFHRDRISGRTPVKVRFVALMAPAVPLYKVRERGSLFEALHDSADAMRIYWSPFDSALGLAFVVGQRYESEQPSLPLSRSRRALGRWGIERRGKMVPRETQYGHGEYWPSRSVASEIRGELIELSDPGPSDRRIDASFVPDAVIAPRKLAA